MVKDIILFFLTGGLWGFVILIRNARKRGNKYDKEAALAEEGTKMIGTYGQVLTETMKQMTEED